MVKKWPRLLEGSNSADVYSLLLLKLFFFFFFFLEFDPCFVLWYSVSFLVL